MSSFVIIALVSSLLRNSSVSRSYQLLSCRIALVAEWGYPNVYPNPEGGPRP
ncbi:MAG: hypothetical protein GF364_02520 [Candidatus Lokiarchaeota archaeon]|nr:hypothetical protein [Candidatus Lokiarchaeota archaeon]